MSLSLSARRAWIEIRLIVKPLSMPDVALRKESVDRNIYGFFNFPISHNVALRKESVDRNILTCFHTKRGRRSLSARRAWIEMPLSLNSFINAVRRSPQGERG